MQNVGDSKSDIISNKEESYSCCDPRSIFYRCLGFGLMCLIGIGYYYNIENPSILQDKIQDNLHITTAQFSLLYSFNAWPNVILCFFGGFLVDRVFGIRLGTILYVVLQTSGQLVFALGVTVNAYWVMLLGMLISGAGGEISMVALTSYLVLWFKKKQLNMVFGLQLSIIRLASSINSWTMESLYGEVSKTYSGANAVGISLFVTSTACFISIISSIILGVMDKKAEKSLVRQRIPEEKVKCSDIKHFNLNFWLICAVAVTFHLAFYPFSNLGKVFFVEKYGTSPDESNVLNSFSYTISAFASPLFGLLIDKTGQTVIWILFSAIFILGAHTFLTFTVWSPYIGMILMGIGYSIYSCSIWTLIPMVIPERQLGTAYGIFYSITNLGLAVISIFSGKIVDESGYLALQKMLIGMSSVNIICVLAIWVKSGKHLNKHLASIELQDNSS